MRSLGTFQILGAGAGRSRATTWSENPHRLWLPSQNGLLAECPQRHSEITVRPASPNALPDGSRISKSPSIRMGPLWNTGVLVGIRPDGSTGELRLTAPVVWHPPALARRYFLVGGGWAGVSTASP